MGTNGAYKMYCIESAKVSFPGNILKPIKRETYFAWPTLPTDESGMYKMTMSLSFTCTITGDELPNEIDAETINTCDDYEGYTLTDDNNYCRSQEEINKDELSTCPSGYDWKEIDNICYKKGSKKTTGPVCSNGTWDKNKKNVK